MNIDMRAISVSTSDDGKAVKLEQSSGFDDRDYQVNVIELAPEQIDLLCQCLQTAKRELIEALELPVAN